jgi:hypothetical protein
MFSNKNFEKLGEDIYVFHNFASTHDCDLICADIESSKDKDWEELYFKRFMSKISVSDYVAGLRDGVALLLKNNLEIGSGVRLQKMMKGSWFGPHTDDHGFSDMIKAIDSYVEGEEYDIVKNNAFGFVVYLNDFEGGEIEYVNQNIKYKPIKGDLLIHGAHETCKHQVNEVLSEKRYCYANNIYEVAKVKKGSLDSKGKANV